MPEYAGSEGCEFAARVNETFVACPVDAQSHMPVAGVCRIRRPALQIPGLVALLDVAILWISWFAVRQPHS
jgi:hypothetical protein